MNQSLSYFLTTLQSLLEQGQKSKRGGKRATITYGGMNSLSHSARRVDKYRSQVVSVKIDSCILTYGP